MLAFASHFDPFESVISSNSRSVSFRGPLPVGPAWDSTVRTRHRRPTFAPEAKARADDLASLCIRLPFEFASPRSGQCARLPPPIPSIPEAPAPEAIAPAQSKEAQLEDEVRQLKAMVRELSSKVDQLSSATAPAGPPTAALSPDELKRLADDVAEPGAGETGATSPLSSGLAGPGGFKKVPGVGDSGLEEAPSSRGVSGGTREFPNSQLDGNRRLGKIPVNGFLDYELDGLGFATADEEFQLRFRLLSQVDYNGYLGPQGQTPRLRPAVSTFRGPVITFRAS